MVECQLCHQKFKIITNSHLRNTHNCEIKDYTKKFGAKGCGFLISPNLLKKTDIRYQKWLESLKNRPSPWCKGQTKETHPSLLKISKTFRKKRIDNFAGWRIRMKETGVIPSSYPTLLKNEDFAELLGVILGDGHIAKYPRTDSLTIFSNSNNQGFIYRYAGFIEKIFDKKPSLLKVKNCNCIRIMIYQKNISKRLKLPTGARGNLKIKIPIWILRNRKFLIRYLRGLYEAEGSFCVHEPTCTYKMLFSNSNESLLNIVFDMLIKLGFHPHRSKCKIQVSRKKEVFKLKKLIKFREY